MKMCVKCKEKKDMNCFVKDSRRPDGHGSVCKQCHNTTCSSYYETHKKQIYDKHKERKREYNKRYRELNRERLSAWFKRHYELNKSKKKQYDYERYAKIRVEALKRMREYRQEHPMLNKERYQRSKIQILAKNRAYQARKRGAVTEDVSHLYASIRNSDLIACHWCGELVPGKSAHVDHVIPLARGGSHTLDNLVPSCRTCNCSKQDKMPDEFMKGRCI